MALGSSAVNILFGCALAYRGSEAAAGPVPLGLLVGMLWFMAVLPTQVIASYLTGRGSVRRLAPSGGTSMREAAAPRYASQTS